MEVGVALPPVPHVYRMRISRGIDRSPAPNGSKQIVYIGGRILFSGERERMANKRARSEKLGQDRTIDDRVTLGLFQVAKFARFPARYWNLKSRVWKLVSKFDGFTVGVGNRYQSPVEKKLRNENLYLKGNGLTAKMLKCRFEVCASCFVK